MPNFETSSPSDLREGNSFIVETLKTFISYEGDENQNLNYVCANLDRDSAIKIQNELSKIKETCLSLAQDDSNKTNVPFVMVSFGKLLTKKDLR